ncbi:hypothetical protein MTO96_034381, partial [Rhipicephalus appendiculatus]
MALAPSGKHGQFWSVVEHDRARLSPQPDSHQPCFVLSRFIFLKGRLRFMGKSSFSSSGHGPAVTFPPFLSKGQATSGNSLIALGFGDVWTVFSQVGGEPGVLSVIQLSSSSKSPFRVRRWRPCVECE